MIYFFFCLIIFIRLTNCKYKINQVGNFTLTNDFNTILNIELKGEDGSFNLESNNIIKFPVYCIPHSTVDYNYKGNKNPLYFIKTEFENYYYLYKNNIKLMEITFHDKYYITGLAANNELLLMITDLDILLLNTKEKKHHVLNFAPEIEHDIFKNKELFFSGIVSDSIENQFFIICSIRKDYYILNIKYDKEKNNINIIFLIDKLDGASLRVVNSVYIIDNRLYIIENAENIIRLNLDRENNDAHLERILTFNNKKIINLVAHTMYDEDKNEKVDYLLVNSKKIFNDVPSTDSCIDLIKINKKNIDVFSIVDLFSEDINSLRFNIYDIHFFIEDKSEEKGLLNAINDKTNFQKRNKKIEEKKINQEESKYILKILWTNEYNCTINKGFIDIRKFVLEKNNEKKLPLTYVENYYSFAPYVRYISHCLRNDSNFKAICYYDSGNNYVNLLKCSEQYDNKFMGNFHFDGYKDYIAYDYKSISNVHIITYPYDNTVYFYFDKKYLTVHLSQPFSISIDKNNSTDDNVIAYFTANDDKNNYIVKCILKKLEKKCACYIIYTKIKEYNELFQYISLITNQVDNKHVTYIYIANNKNKVYRLNKIDNKYIFSLWFQLSQSQRIGPISTSLNYFFVTREVLDKFIELYPESGLLSKFKNAKKGDLHITDDKYIYLTSTHTLIFCVSNDEYGNDMKTSINFYTSLFQYKYHQSFLSNGMVINISNDSKLNYYLDG